ncbi:MAG: HAD family hydrolase [Gaiellaceae bacterium]
MAPRAAVFDFNGTLSDDEPILFAIYEEMFAEQGRPLTQRQYIDELAGHSEEEIIGSWLGRDRPDFDELVAERIARYREAVADGSTVYPEVREAVRYAAERVPVAIVSGAASEEILPVVNAAGLAPFVAALVAADDVIEGKPHPEGYLRALELLGDGIRAGEVVVFEDTEVGVAAAKAAGMYCVGITRTLGPARLAAADELIPEIDLAAVRRLLA